MQCPECGSPIKKGSYICANCKFNFKLIMEVNRKKGKKEKNYNKTIKIEESRPSPVQGNKKTKRNLKKSIELLYDRLIKDSFQERT